MAKLTNKELPRTIEIATGALPSGMAKAFEDQAKGSKVIANATGALVDLFLNNEWDFRHTISPCKNDGITLNEESNSKLSPAQYAELMASRAKGFGQLTLFKTNPEFLTYQVNQAKKGVKVATSAVASAKSKKAKDAATKSLMKAEQVLIEAQAKKSERNELVKKCASALKDLRKALSRALFKEQRTYLLNDGKAPKDADLGAAKYVAQLQKAANTSVKYGGEKHLPEDKPELKPSEANKEAFSIIGNTMDKLKDLPPTDEIKHLIEMLSKVEPLH